MKKFIAVMMACLMLFSVAIVPGFATEVDNSADSGNVSAEYETETFTKSMGKYLVSILDSLHSAIHQVLDLIGFDCPLCTE